MWVIYVYWRQIIYTDFHTWAATYYQMFEHVIALIYHPKQHWRIKHQILPKEIYQYANPNGNIWPQNI